MEKNRIRSVKTGKSMRMSYQRQKEVLEMPNLIERMTLKMQNIPSHSVKNVT